MHTPAALPRVVLGDDFDQWSLLRIMELSSPHKEQRATLELVRESEAATFRDPDRRRPLPVASWPPQKF